MHLLFDLLLGLFLVLIEFLGNGFMLALQNLNAVLLRLVVHLLSLDFVLLGFHRLLQRVVLVVVFVFEG